MTSSMPEMMRPPPEPVTDLAKPRLLSPNAAVRVSPLCLGAMSIGSEWEGFMGSMNKEQSFKLLDAFVAAGGNFVDTANNYQNEQSETWLGEWMAARKNRDQLVIATKYTALYRSYELGKSPAVAGYGGNGKKSLHLSIRDSLRKLQTDYIDILYLHWWDYTSTIEEVMDSLHALVVSGKVLYLGISDTPAWIVSAANTYAKSHGKTPFVVYQGQWSIMNRDFERDIIPMARQFGMALAPWGVLGGGKLQTKKQVAARQKEGERLRSFGGGGGQTEQEEKMSEALEKVADAHGVQSIQAVALAYVMQKAPYVFPIIGGRKVEHLQDNILGLGIHLSDEQMKSLEAVAPFDLGFPITMIGENPRYSAKGGFMWAGQGLNMEWQKEAQPIGHQ